MYLGLHAIAFGREAERLSDTSVNQRNRVIHQGKTPSIDETIDFGRKIAEAIDSANFDLKKNFNTYQEVLMQQMRLKSGSLTLYIVLDRLLAHLQKINQTFQLRSIY